MTRARVRLAALATLACLSACRPSDAPPPSDEARRAHKAAIAAAAQDRLVLQAYVKEAEIVEARVPSLRKISRGFLRGDTSVIWFGYFAGDSLIVLDETRRLPERMEENARYFFRDTLLRYVVLDRRESAQAGTPARLRLAFGFDTAMTLVATSKNVNDAAVPLDSAVDIRAVAARATALRQLVLRDSTH